MGLLYGLYYIFAFKSPINNWTRGKIKKWDIVGKREKKSEPKKLTKIT